MKHADPYHAYLNVADELAEKRISARDLPGLTRQLPSLDQILLMELGRRSEEVAAFHPRQSWAISKVAYQAAMAQDQGLFVRSLAAWYMGRAYNHWGKPNQVKTIISQAQRGFLKLGEPGWIAACEWQLYNLPWTKPNILEAEAVLKRALAGLQRAQFEEFVPHCRLALAFAQLLISEWHAAERNVLASEAIFQSHNDDLNQARCWLHMASLLRRRDQIDRALEWLHQALIIFENTHSFVDIAKTHYQIGLCHLIWAEDLSIAKHHFELAIELFAEREMDLWQAQCVNNLGFVYLLTGSLGKANSSFEQARKSFKRHGVWSLLADNLNDHAKLNNARGLPAISIEQFRQALEINEQLGLKNSQAINLANLGEACALSGRYQDALHYLEQAVERFQQLKNFTYLSSARKFLASVWSRLGDPAVALQYLDQAMSDYQTANKAGTLASFYNTRASILFSQNRTEEAGVYLERSLEDALSHQMEPQASLARRLLGEALVQSGEHGRALKYLEQARADFNKTGMLMEEAATLVAIGLCYVSGSRTEEAKKAFETALQISAGTMPEVDWRAHAGLAKLAEERGELPAELRSYRQTMNALARIRHNFWQPGIAGSYLQTPRHFLDHAIRRSAQIPAVQEAIEFIEQNKSTTLLTQLKQNMFVNRSKKSEELINLGSEIAWLQNQLRASFDPHHPVRSAIQTRQIRCRLVEKMRDYDRAVSRQERQAFFKTAPINTQATFDLSVFREFASTALGNSWLALDYYIVSETLITVVVTPEQCDVLSTPLTGRTALALRMSTKSKSSAQLLEDDLRVLGDLLIPAAIAEQFTGSTHLVVAPHGPLHHIPWGAIQPTSLSRPLALACVPCITPSLQSLCMLWGRKGAQAASERHAGLVVGVSDFQGHMEDLPHVKAEVAALQTLVGSRGTFLMNAEATWAALTRVQGSGGKRGPSDVARSTCLHLATHFSADTHTGQLSGFRLWDRDVWLDQLRDLAPLPGLVTLSACNSMLAFLHEGDEHVDFPSACFIAGANSIVGCLWPVLDEAAAQFTLSFYEHYLAGKEPARALNEAQKQMIQSGEPISAWAGFVCMGVP